MGLIARWNEWEVWKGWEGVGISEKRRLEDDRAVCPI